jgi:tripartite-type tricarboxylate transporter receptor subunit TctC
MAMTPLAISRRRFCAGLSAAAVPTWARSQADKFPSKPVRMFIPFSAGALIDILARMYGERMSQSMGQPFVVDNRPGAGGIAATQAMLALPPDGHQMLFISSAHSVNPLIQKLPYDTAHDFAGVALLANAPSLVVVPADHPAKTLAQFIEIGRRKPESLNFGSAGVASATHLAGEQFAQEAGIRFVHVPFKGVQEAVNEVIAGRLDVAFPPPGLAVAYMKAGKLRALAVTSPERLPLIPDIPTVAESGLPGFEYAITYGVIMAAKTPRQHLEFFAEQFTALTRTRDIREKLMAQGMIPRDLVLADFDAYIARETDKLGRVVKSGNFKL